MKKITSICVEYKHVDDGSGAWHVFTSEQIRGLLVASKDPEVAYNDVATSIQLLLQLNEGVKCVVRPELTVVSWFRLQEARTKIEAARHQHNTATLRIELESIRYRLAEIENQYEPLAGICGDDPTREIRKKTIQAARYVVFGRKE